ncbi:MAG: selenocysteine-specific translation elongation factor [Myxococcota bacterium]|nr:selenocysteine-specific translation elongation factor [Myxococcota bacterium]
MKTLNIGTAGHIDHGKSSLVQALSGLHPDQLPEEKKRGITIDLGFVPWQISPEQTIHFIDVPGHEKFVRTMIAGASGIHMALLVVAADDGVMPQTREHFDILRLLNVEIGRVIITKSDLSDPELLELLEEEISELVAGTIFEKHSPIRVSSKTGEGLTTLKQELTREVTMSLNPNTEGPTYIPIDRSFSSSGRGLIATGTINRGHISQGDVLAAFSPNHGYFGKIKIREIQNARKSIESSHRGMRTALNLSGRLPRTLERGSLLVSPESFQPTQRIVVQLSPLVTLTDAKNIEAMVHIGTFEILGTIIFESGIETGQKVSAIIKLKKPILTFAGQKFIVRQPGLRPIATIGGGTIIDPFAPTGKGSVTRSFQLCSKYHPETQLNWLESLVANCHHHGLSEAELTQRLPENWEPKALLNELVLNQKIVSAQEGKYWFHRALVCERAKELKDIVSDVLKTDTVAEGVAEIELQSRLPYLSPALFRATLTLGQELGWLVRAEQVITLPGRRPTLTPSQEPLATQIFELFEDSEFTPPTDKELATSLKIAPKELGTILAYLRYKNKIVRLKDNQHLGSNATEQALQAIIHAFQTDQENLGASTFKEALGGISRKWLIPILEYADKQQVTIRHGNERRLHSKIMRSN